VGGIEHASCRRRGFSYDGLSGWRSSKVIFRPFVLVGEIRIVPN